LALVFFPCWDTPENGRTALTRATLDSLWYTLNPSLHRLIVVDNGSCLETAHLLREAQSAGQALDIITNDRNRGVAYACNQVLERRQPGEIVIKMDNDVHFRRGGWADDLVACIEREPLIGICGLKRKDEKWWPLVGPDNDGIARPSESRFIALPHEPGQRWLAVEKTPWLLVGTCIALNPAFLDAVGGFWHPSGQYGHEDTILAARCRAAGFWSCYWPWVEIDHIDPMADDAYARWKAQDASDFAQEAVAACNDILTGKRGYFFPIELDKTNSARSLINPLQ